MAQHELKTISPYFEDIQDGRKTFEVRRADRAFQVGDELILQHYDPKKQQYLGPEVHRFVTYILKGTGFLESDYMGIDHSYVVMSLEKEVGTVWRHVKG